MQECCLRLQPALVAGSPGAGVDVAHREAAAAPQHPEPFGQRLLLIGHRRQAALRENAVEASARKWQPGAIRGNEFRPIRIRAGIRENQKIGADGRNAALVHQLDGRARGRNRYRPQYRPRQSLPNRGELPSAQGRRGEAARLRCRERTRNRKAPRYALAASVSYETRLTDPAAVPVRRLCPTCVIPEAACGYPGSQQAPAIVTIPDNASGISGVTPESKPISRISYHLSSSACSTFSILPSASSSET